MSSPEADAHSIAAFQKFYKLLPRGSDISLLILKLHLLVEEQIRTFLEERVASTKALAAAKLDCHQAICLAEALCTDNIQSQVWEAARKLNSLRNHIAHNLEHRGIIDRMNSISSLIGIAPELFKIDGKTPEGAAVENLTFSVSVLHSEISLYVKRKPAHVLSIVHPEPDA